MFVNCLYASAYNVHCARHVQYVCCKYFDSEPYYKCTVLCRILCHVLHIFCDMSTNPEDSRSDCGQQKTGLAAVLTWSSL
jgi:hypothetical protein